LGNSTPVSLNEFIKTCEDVTNRKANYKQIEEQLGDVPVTYANISKAKELLDYDPKVNLKDGLTNTYNWLVSNIDDNYSNI